MVERLTKRAVTQVVMRGVAAEKGPHAAPRLDLAQGAEGDDLKQPVFRCAGFIVVAHITNHVLTYPVGRPEDVAKLERLQNGVICPRGRKAGYATLKGCLPLGREVPVVNHRSFCVVSAVAGSSLPIVRLDDLLGQDCSPLTVEHSGAVQVKVTRSRSRWRGRAWALWRPAGRQASDGSSRVPRAGTLQIPRMPPQAGERRRATKVIISCSRAVTARVADRAAFGNAVLLPLLVGDVRSYGQALAGVSGD